MACNCHGNRSVQLESFAGFGASPGIVEYDVGFQTNIRPNEDQPLVTVAKAGAAKVAVGAAVLFGLYKLFWR